MGRDSLQTAWAGMTMKHATQGFASPWADERRPYRVQVAMNTPRAQLIEAVADLCQQYPDWRFGQLIAKTAT
jgi:hypothetical protein